MSILGKLRGTAEGTGARDARTGRGEGKVPGAGRGGQGLCRAGGRGTRGTAGRGRAPPASAGGLRGLLGSLTRRH